MSRYKSSYEEAEEFVKSDRRDYVRRLAMGWHRALLQSFLIATAATPIVLFWFALLVIQSDPTIAALPASIREIAFVLFIVSWTLAFLMGPSPDAVVQIEVERLRNVLLAKNLAVDALRTDHWEEPSTR